MEKSIEKPTGEFKDELEEKQIEELLEKEPIETTEEFIEEEIQEVQEGSIEEEIEVEESIEEVEEEIEEGQKRESLKDKIKERVKKHKKLSIGLGISFCTLIIMYFVMTLYFIDHFYFGTEINSISVSGKTSEEAKEVMATGLNDYTLTIKDRAGIDEKIKGKDIELQYISQEEIKDFKDRQNPFKWIIALFNKENTKASIELFYDEILFKKQIDRLSYFKGRKIIEPKNASLQYGENQYEIVDEILGNKVDRAILTSQAADFILKNEIELDLESAGCYIEPQYHSKSREVIEAKNTLNRYVSSKITYTFAKDKEFLDGDTINKWLEVDEKFQVIINEEKVKEYMSTLAKTYNTVGKTRNFITASGKTIKVGGGDYGWAIDQAKETQNLISSIKEGKTITKEPEYHQRAFAWGSNDIGNTYVEIDLSGQHMWFYKKGSLVTHGNVVTGNVQKNHTTPPGVFRLKYKSRNVVLRGPDYASPVTFWMPFNGGIGIHDASWRSVFGGNIYKTNGSHGCINSPYKVAKAIFDNISPDTPVICY
ncbi:L,D-transpeptidase/peptidoglycan binding protein [Irregularibacter muris]|uniref:L,D-transpeptidase/peptidoglycan binding protein n=1 Tax=Irregularibacter muris TaxID=1796619 RepID=A0AAE3HF13_9FIRM|nr:L,D-transpeptidase/peptidoglycan binding protein [Irregularibacter muris]MCR1897383.1 L,D-transpeptidase/peptidoglycan binding protein [Irregularibacter muris]